MEKRSGSILVVDGDPVLRGEVASALERVGYVTRPLASGVEALAEVAEELPALVLLEVRLPDMTGYEVCRELREAHGDGLPVFLMSSERTEPMDRVAGLLLGADDFIVKPFDADELVARVRRFVQRRVPIHGDLSATLTCRELEVLSLLGDGLTQKEIATRLSISTTTVGTHIQRLLTKSGAHSRAQLVAVAYRHGLV